MGVWESATHGPFTGGLWSFLAFVALQSRMASFDTGPCLLAGDGASRGIDAMGRTCAICDIPIKHWELCCAACTAGLAPDDPEFVLAHSPSLLSRIVDACALSIAAVCIGLAAMRGAGFIVTNVIVSDLHGGLRTIAALLLLLATIIVLALCFVLLGSAKDKFTSVFASTELMGDVVSFDLRACTPRASRVVCATYPPRVMSASDASCRSCCPSGTATKS